MYQCEDGKLYFKCNGLHVLQWHKNYIHNSYIDIIEIYKNVKHLLKYKYICIQNYILNTEIQYTPCCLVCAANVTHLKNTDASITRPITGSVAFHSLDPNITLSSAVSPSILEFYPTQVDTHVHVSNIAHVPNIARTCYFELRRLASIRRFLTSTATATLVSAFVLSRIDYCNSLLFGSTHDVTSHLQRIQNYAARVILRLPMSSSITIHLKSLHWLPVKVRCTYKIDCLCYHCHSSTAPSYVTDMLHKKPLHTRNTRSSSYTMPLLNRPAHSKATLGDRSFSFASSSVWNSIPNDVMCAPSLSSFKFRLKTYLFRSVYKD